VVFFGKRWAELCLSYKANVHILNFPWNSGVDPNEVRAYLKQHPEIENIFMVQNESSTAVLNDVKAVSEAREGHQSIIGCRFGKRPFGGTTHGNG